MPVNYYIFFSLALFCIGIVGVLSRRNAIIIFMCVELMLNAVNLLLVSFSKLHSQEAVNNLAMIDKNKAEATALEAKLPSITNDSLRNITEIQIKDLRGNADSFKLTAADLQREATSGQLFVFFIMVVAAAEVTVGLAIIVMMYRNVHSVDVNFLNRLKY